MGAHYGNISCMREAGREGREEQGWHAANFDRLSGEQWDWRGGVTTDVLVECLVRTLDAVTLRPNWNLNRKLSTALGSRLPRAC